MNESMTPNEPIAIESPQESQTREKGSFCRKTKEALCAIPIRKKCCRYLWDCVTAFPKGEPMAEQITTWGDSCRCDNCMSVLLRALFCRYGAITDPTKRYHLELAFPNEAERDAAAALLEQVGFAMHGSMRHGANGKDKWILYYKSSADMEDLLAYIGASTAAFELMNAKIVKEFRNSVNRQVNCDTANIEKQLEASKKYVEAIRTLTETGAISKLPEALQQTARLRLEYEQVSLAELGNLCEPKVSKSGMKHRMEKLLEYAHRIHSVDRINSVDQLQSEEAKEETP